MPFKQEIFVMNAVLAPSVADFAAIKQRQQLIWASGNYATIGTTLQIVGETLAEAADLRFGQAVLDVAAGNGNASLAAARRGALVTSTDFVQELLDKGRTRAQAEGLSVHFQRADAEALPFADGSFDAVLSTFGVMFTPNHSRAASEMLRTVRSGGCIAMANWTPNGFIGRLFKTIGAHVPPPAGVQPASAWGTEAHIVDLFGAQAAHIRCERRVFNFRYRSAAHWLQVFRDWYGPMLKAFATLDAIAAQALTRDITRLLDEHNVAGPDSLLVPGEYLEVVIAKQ